MTASLKTNCRIISAVIWIALACLANGRAFAQGGISNVWVHQTSQVGGVVSGTLTVPPQPDGTTVPATVTCTGVLTSQTVSNGGTFSFSPGSIGLYTISATSGSITGWTGTGAIYAFTPKLTPYDTSIPSHSTTQLGVGEPAALSVVLTPSAAPVTFVWKDSSTKANLKDKGDGSGNGTYYAAPVADTDTLTLTDSNGATGTIAESVILPTVSQTAYTTDTRAYHDGYDATAEPLGPYPSAGDHRLWTLSPANVSWVELETTEVDCEAASADGTLSSATGVWHRGGGSQDTSPAWVGYDYYSSYGATISEVPGGYYVDNACVITHVAGTGDATYNIQYSYKVLDDRTPGTVYTGLTTLSQVMTITSASAASVSKGGLTCGPVALGGAGVESYVGPYMINGVKIW